MDWTAFDATVLRSTWDYTVRRAEFLAWAERVPRLHNPVAVIRANSDKRYLADLAEAGMPVVPTTFFGPAEPVRAARTRASSWSSRRSAPVRGGPAGSTRIAADTRPDAAAHAAGTCRTRAGR